MNYLELVNKLKEKYNYSDELCTLLEKAIPAILTYYGNDKYEFVEKALLNCEIHIQKEDEETKDYLNNYYDTNKEWKMPFIAGAVQHRELIKNENGFSSKSIIYIKTKYLNEYKPYDLNDSKKQSQIIHEICHAIKSTRNLEINENNIIEHTGIAIAKTKLEQENVIEEGQERMGLEEALTSYEEASIMSLIRGEEQVYGAYKNLTSMARLLLEDEELKELIIKSEFYGGEEWINYLGSDYKDIINEFNEVLSTFYLSPSELLNNKDEIFKRRDAAIDKFIEYYKERKKKNELNDMFETEQNTEEKSHVL